VYYSKICQFAITKFVCINKQKSARNWNIELMREMLILF